MCYKNTPRTIFLSAILTLSAFIAQAQIEADIPLKMTSKEFTPPTPAGAALGQYGDVPVSYNTGVPNISIPIFTIPLRSFSLPISLSYHAGGIRVDQTASNVGLGWVLNAGGSISVSTLSKSDFDYPLWEMPPIPWSVSSPVPAFTSYTPTSWYDMFNDADLGYFFLLGYFAPSLNAEATIANFEPDDISYNFAGFSGKIIRKVGSPLFETVPTSSLYITDSLEIIDESGNLFRFEEEESSGGADPFLTSYNFWLSKVYTPDGDSITFTYEEEGQCYFSSVGETQYALVPNSNGCTVPIEQNPLVYNKMGVNAKVLKRITSSNGYVVDFEYHANSRVDVIGSHSLKGIVVRYQVDGDTTEVTRFDLYHNDASGTTTTINCGNFDSDDLGFVSSYRLVLDSVKQAGLPPYRFTYNSTPLPPRFSHKQDLWGYANNNEYESLVPIVPRVYRFEGADRTPDSVAMKAGVLEKIQYPTGGFTEFDFEPHKYYTEGEEVIGYGSASCSAPTNQNNTCYFTIPSTAFGRVKIVFDFPAGTQAGVTHIPTSQTLLVDNTANPSSETEMAATPGNYSVTITNFGSAAPASIDFSWINLDSVHNVNRIGGGLRVKEVRNYTAAGQLALKRKLTYNKPDTTISSARTSRIPNAFQHFSKRFIKWNPRIDPNYGSGPPYYMIECYYSSIHNQDISSDARPVSTSFTYEYVTETVDNGQFGKTTYQYADVEEILAMPRGSLPAEVMDAVDGQLISKKDYKDVSGSLHLVRKEQMTYSNELFSSSAYAKGYKFEMTNGGQINEVNGSVHTWTPAEFYFTSYNYFNITGNMTSKQVVQYLPDSIVTQNEYTYSENLLVADRLIAAKDTLQTTYSYETLTIAGVERTINKPNLVRIMRFADAGSMRAGGVSTAKSVDYQTVSGNFVPTEVYELENVAPLDKTQVAANLKSRVVFEEYDANANPLTLVDQTNVRTSFIWGKNNLMLAQVVNASNDAVAFTSFEHGDLGTFSLSGTTDDNSEGKTGLKYMASGTLSKSSLPSASYKVTFWARKMATGTVTVNGNGISIPSTDWALYEYTFTGTSVSLVLSNAEIDEVRLFPVGAQMTTYTYKPGIGIATVMDTNGIMQYYEYDSRGRLYLVRDANKNIVSQHLYNYAGND